MIRAVSLFSGIGGLDYGFEAAGYELLAAFELDAIAAENIRLNRDWRVIEADLTRCSARDVLRKAHIKRHEIDIVIAGPPCQPFSKAAYWRKDGAARLRDPRSRTLDAFLRTIEHVRPQAFLLENVPGFAFQGKAEGLEHLKRGIEKINASKGTRYAISWAKLNAADFGVPQLRERIFLVASRDGLAFTFPTPTHCRTGKAKNTEAYRTCWDALGDLSNEPDEVGLELRGKWAQLLPSIPEGKNYLWHTNRGGGEPLFGWRTRYWSFLLKLAKDQPSWTIQSQTGSAIGPFHWTNRKLSTKELLRLQSFPEDVNLKASRARIQAMVGNAVPSLLAEVLAREIRIQLFGETISRRPKLLRPILGKPPRRYPARSIPECYWHLIGDHPDHPGEGLGVGAHQLTAR